MWMNTMTNRMSFAAQRAIRPTFFKTPLHSIPAAGFAKYDRSKPHLNVGTIGKFRQIWRR